MENLREKYITKSKRKELRKELKDYTINELKELVIKLTPLEKAQFKYILERDNHKCRFCGTKYNLEVHHITPRSLGGTNHEYNLITLCNGCHSFLHLNPFGKVGRTKLIASMMVKKNGKTFSKYGNKWGRKTMSEEKQKRVKELRSNGLTYREIAEKMKISIGKISEIVNNKRK